ncbi:winged helix-turn-helix domain-containing protein [Nocardiopsis ansamitocini]|uniref:OmpR/PhoB-type domain-containing protein n=1 Tax=Nocardiopsis ansamitocini TaxID=1670832 RepID=A0A9W6P6N7_9ACTN|nr:winged helix-turn-helix domain-containing protein [Nocardiopsis ansamitocini]GLU48445.1 hypothetical protein Nans01_27960 [Nocardiopsis ansamitocini]
MSHQLTVTERATHQWPHSALLRDLTPGERAAIPLPAHIDSDAMLGVVPLDDGAVMVVVGHVVTPPGPTCGDDLVLDRRTRSVRLGGRDVELSFQEFELLAHLRAAPHRVFTRTELLDQVWPGHRANPRAEGTRTVDVHMHRLRRKLPAVAAHLVTVRRVGYAYRPTT